MDRKKDLGKKVGIELRQPPVAKRTRRRPLRFP
jgi:hypothetical protein